ncbi:hypothetical protein QJS10_CPA06g01050 [Acorus calamus]|uniref:Uncharacterized protein n=1 Tax=Acorus calamus TaxID=4465 RepID=A0AAV9EMI3_ACOCL|nr:hypothetical protein QJS10_CPA06g01050 [Acorus calamus]
MRSGTLEYWEDGTETEEKQKWYYGYSQKLKHIVRLPFATIAYVPLDETLYNGAVNFNPWRQMNPDNKVIGVGNGARRLDDGASSTAKGNIQHFFSDRQSKPESEQDPAQRRKIRFHLPQKVLKDWLKDPQKARGPKARPARHGSFSGRTSPDSGAPPHKPTLTGHIRASP